jgi:hypothetical protein
MAGSETLKNAYKNLVRRYKKMVRPEFTWLSTETIGGFL